MRLALVLLIVLAPFAHAQLPIARKPLDAPGQKRRNGGIREYKSLNFKHIRPLRWPINEYFCRRVSGFAKEDATFVIDEVGLPLRRDARGDWHHPITLARHVMNISLTYMNRREPQMLEWTRTAADKLVSIMGPDGAFRYPYPYNLYYYGELPAGWTSAMAQGSALSAYARAYHATCDRRYIDAGEKALDYLLMPMEKGGTTTTLRYLHPSLAEYVWYEEYPNAAKPAYTLNGFMYTLLGLYDWAEATGSPEARKAFDGGVRSLLKVLPLFDYDGFSCYDLAPIVYGRTHLFPARYHRVHLMQLSALHAITGEPAFEEYRARWYSSVGGPIQTCGGPE